MGFSVSATLTSSQKVLASSLEHFDVVTRDIDAVSMNCMPSHDHLRVKLQSCPVSSQIKAPPEEEAKADSESVAAKPPTRATKKRGITASVASQKAGGEKKVQLLLPYMLTRNAQESKELDENVPLDIMKFAMHCILTRKDWNTIIDNMICLLNKTSYHLELLFKRGL
ncbi:hypothetical protein Tco_1222721 [Tanacetum coccineum]